ncbi:hypothetical protein BDDG_12344 [Blastomyces dermatitidis ATCC 18188]|uniref:Uncharacterized protein n=1 Tax=Ajellomyces dermatitidis (strain ATCC 18188 / CBS 674.68) TaxID=653446 RepID=A0A0J9EP39_AJEDA|nr:hypothetical protein BDDG_12344 [Blastomyces dermatitidis ATCC 18188]
MISFEKCDKSRHQIGNETIKKSDSGPRHGHTIRDNSVELLDIKDVKFEYLHCENTSLQRKLNHVLYLLEMAVEFIKDD